jgi:hypothetical protein
MKPFSSLSREELMALNEDQVCFYIDLQCADYGVALLPEAPVKPEPVDIVPDIECWYTCGELYASKRDADAVAEFAMQRPSRRETIYLQSWSGPQGVKQAESGVNVAARRYWSAAHYDTHAQALAKHKAAQESYEQAKTRYDDIAGERAQIVEEIQGKIELAHAAAHLEADIVGRFSEYLVLADSNTGMALAFFLKAAPKYGWTEEEVKQALNIGEEL